MTEQLLKNQDALGKIIEEKDRQIADLQDQLNDLLMHIEGQKAIEKSDIVDELRVGSIRLVESPERRPPPSKHSGTHINRRKRK